MASRLFSKNLLFEYGYWGADKFNRNVCNHEFCKVFSNVLTCVRNSNGDSRVGCEEVPTVTEPCAKRWTEKKGALHWIKLKMIEGGTNFGTPFKMLKCKEEVCEKKALPAPKEEKETKLIVTKIRPPTPGLNVTILGGDTPMGHYTAMLLKQCPCINRINLYKAKEGYTEETRPMSNVVSDLHHMDTKCVIRAFENGPGQLDLALQNADIVLMLEHNPPNLDMPVETRFYCQAPDVKKYADSISHECPKAFVIVCITPIDCMVPLVCEILKETRWYNPGKVLGSLAVAEMRATTLAARALGLEPRTARVPCVGGTEGPTLVPLFSRAVEFFEFAKHNAELLTETVRFAPKAVSYTRPGDLSEAHAQAGIVKAVAYALLGQDRPRVSGFVETDLSNVISPARYIANPVEIGINGISQVLGIPPLSDYELEEMHVAITELGRRLCLTMNWYKRFSIAFPDYNHSCKNFFYPQRFPIFDECASSVL